MDQLRSDALGYSGGWVKTPALDRLAREGMQFTNCVTTSPVCVPARFSQATGLYPHQLNVWDNDNVVLNASVPTWMQSIRRSGYRTSLFGKLHLFSDQRLADIRKRAPLLHAYGFDDIDEVEGPISSIRNISNLTAQWYEQGYWSAFRRDLQQRFHRKRHVVRASPLPLELYFDNYIGQQALNYLRSYQHPQPWMCMVSFTGPHDPFDTPEPYASYHAPEDMPPPRTLDMGQHPRPLGNLDAHLAKNRIHFEPGEVARIRSNYAGNVSLIDEQIGRILTHLEDSGALEKTAIFVVADHGEMLGDANCLYKKVFLDGAVRVPLLARVPGVTTAGQVSDTLVEWSDLGPTLVALAGGTLHPQGARSFLPTLIDPDFEHREFALCEFNHEGMLLTRQWKAAFNSKGLVYLLFDRNNDPLESRNLAGLPHVASVEGEMTMKLRARFQKLQLLSGALPSHPVKFLDGRQ